MKSLTQMNADEKRMNADVTLTDSAIHAIANIRIRISASIGGYQRSSASGI